MMYNFIWVVVDWFIKMALFLLYKKNTGAETLARFFKKIFTNYSLLKSIISDRGSVFAAKFTGALYKALDIKQNLLKAFYFQTND